MISKPSFIVVGCGYAGAVMARQIAEQLNKDVLIIDKREHIAGNMYDYTNSYGIPVHKYGPHISVMDQDKTYHYLSRFTEWIPYRHRVNAVICGKEVPLPINFTSIDLLFPKKADSLKKSLIRSYGENANIPIMTLKKNTDPDIRELSDFIFENVFLHYTEKMWGLTPEEIDPGVTARIPIRLSYNDDHFLHKYQVMPKDGFTKLFENLLDHPNITVQLSTNSLDLLSLSEDKQNVIYNGAVFKGTVVYTGALDEFFNYTFGELPYRSLEFEFEDHKKDYIQNTPVLNWPDTRRATRRTEMKRLVQKSIPDHTTTITEYPGAYSRSGKHFNQPLYPIANNACFELHQRYKKLADRIDNFYYLGRLADYKYYNMEATILRALSFFEEHFAG
ncbi:Probable UDP-galactopyranose mutase [Anaerotruncus sp. 2789STDY5834896]|uniref:Probable UDP-galactopyranose mutase n=1 Tax=uncultured Anaerotruncus sp. TaxID=905011 RepID=A0A1C6JEE1_9FIRM|nr:Probable UDP-galactopyranose mutase [uncultured Anaerotruncus sp.]